MRTYIRMYMYLIYTYVHMGYYCNALNIHTAVVVSVISPPVYYIQSLGQLSTCMLATEADVPLCLK